MNKYLFINNTIMKYIEIYKIVSNYIFVREKKYKVNKNYHDKDNFKIIYKTDSSLKN